MSRTWPQYLPLALAAIMLAVALLTGKAFNPLSGMRPMIVDRLNQPGRYWASVVITAVVLAVAGWIAWAPVSS
jgi:hypothetical protein